MRFKFARQRWRHRGQIRAVVADSCDYLPCSGFSRLKTQLAQAFGKRPACFRAIQWLILDNHLHRLSHSPPVV